MNPDFYLRFEAEQRGHPDAIRQRLVQYLHSLEPIVCRHPGAAALDLGCGRGEWLALLKEQGWQAFGADNNSAMVDHCQQDGLENVTLGDALRALEAWDDGSLYLVSAFHLVEHLPFDVLLALVAEAYRVLAPGGVLLLETPNPENPSVGHYSFYFDPTHEKPLPPPLLHFVVADAGFSAPVVLRVNGPEEPDPDASSEARIRWALAAYPDYAVLAERPGGSAGFDRSTMEQLASERIASIDLIARELSRLGSAVDRLDTRVTAMCNSRSWRYTAPFRVASRALRGVGRHAQMGVRGGLAMIARQPALRRTGAKVLRPFPRFKSRLARLAAPYAYPASLSEASGGEDDYVDILPVNNAWVGRRSLIEAQEGGQAGAAPLGLLIDGHFNGSYSLAAINRALVVTLQRDRPDLTLCIQPRHGEPCVLADLPGGDEEYARFAPLCDPESFLALPVEQRVCLYHHYPPVEKPDRSRGLPIALFFWEESRVPDSIVRCFNRYYAGLLVTAWSVKKALIDSGCQVPVRQINMPLLPMQDTAAPAAERDGAEVVEAPTTVHLLHISSCFPRKGVDRLLQAFERVARQSTAVRLTIKTFPNPHNDIEAQIDRWVAASRRERITLINQDCDAATVRSLYDKADIVVLPSRGEGLNLPAIEAGQLRKPLIVTGYGAHTDFLDEQTASLVPWRFEPARTHLSPPLSLWADPSPKALAEQLLKVIGRVQQGDKHLVSQTDRLATRLYRRHLAPGTTAPLLNAVGRLHQRHMANAGQESNSPPIVLVTTWESTCGIAEYSRCLVREFLRKGDRVQVLAPMPGDSHCSPVEQRDTTLPNADSLTVTRNWRSGVAPDLLVDGASLIRPEGVLWLQYHPAFYPLTNDLADTLAAHVDRGGQVHMTLHNTRSLLELRHEDRRAAAACLARCHRIYGHTVDDLNVLKRLGIVHNTTLMPQGVSQPSERVLAIEPSSEPQLTIGAFGFLLPHKGISELIRAFAALHRTDARLRLVTTVREQPESKRLLEDCRRLARRLGVSHQLEWHTDFLPLEEVQSLLRACHLVVLPYRQTAESSSAAARTVLAACPQLITTPARIFDELGGACVRTDGYDAKAISRALTRGLEGWPGDVTHALEKARQGWLADNEWSLLVDRYRAIFKAMV